MFRITPIRSAALAAVAALLAVAAPAGATAHHAGHVAAPAYIDDVRNDTSPNHRVIGEDILPPYLRRAAFSSLPEVGDEVLVMERRPDGIIAILTGL